MNLIFCNLIAALVTISAIAGAVFLAREEKDGWGWLIFLAIATHTIFISKKGKGKKEDRTEAEENYRENIIRYNTRCAEDVEIARKFTELGDTDASNFVLQRIKDRQRPVPPSE